MKTCNRYTRLLLWFIPALVAFCQAFQVREHHRFREINVPFRQTQIINALGVDGICRTSATLTAETDVTTRYAETLVVGMTSNSTFMEKAPYTLLVTHSGQRDSFTPTESRYRENENGLTQYRGRFQAKPNHTYRIRLQIHDLDTHFQDGSATLTVNRAIETRLGHILPGMGLFYLGIGFLAAGSIIFLRDKGRESGR